MERLVPALLLACLGGLACGRARAQPAVDLQTFQPPAGQPSTFTVEDPGGPGHLQWVFGAHLNYAHRLLERSLDPEEVSVASDRLQLETAAALGLFDWLELGVVVPFVVQRSADSITLPARIEPSFSLGDLRLSAELTLVHGRFPLSLVAIGSVPSGRPWAGSAGATFQGGVVFAPRFGPLTWASRVVYRARPPVALGGYELDDELQVSTGVAWALLESLSAILEGNARVALGAAIAESALSPWEIDAGVRLRLGPVAVLDLGLGTGLPPGRDGYGAPDIRAFAMCRLALPRHATGSQDDLDGDGVPGDRDRCPRDPEDRDGFHDADGCPDVDNDADGIEDGRDACPTRSEDRDGFQDGDGCPEPDNDGDGVDDGQDSCPMDSEDPDGFEDGDGCPEPGPEPLTVTVTDTRILVSEQIFFEFDRDVIRSVSVPTLEKVAATIRELPPGRRVRVEGHSDQAGNEDYNLDLSYRRAAAVARFLESRGVAPERLEYRGLGSRRPVAPNDTPEGRTLNRRVGFVILDDR